MTTHREQQAVRRASIWQLLLGEQLQEPPVDKAESSCRLERASIYDTQQDLLGQAWIAPRAKRLSVHSDYAICRFGFVTVAHKLMCSYAQMHQSIQVCACERIFGTWSGLDWPARWAVLTEQQSARSLSTGTSDAAFYAPLLAQLFFILGSSSKLSFNLPALDSCTPWLATSKKLSPICLTHNFSSFAFAIANQTSRPR